MLVLCTRISLEEHSAQKIGWQGMAWQVCAMSTCSLQAAGEELARSRPEGIDCLINNAGISGTRTRPIEQ